MKRGADGLSNMCHFEAHEICQKQKSQGSLECICPCHKAKS